MTPAENYAEAERLVGAAANASSERQVAQLTATAQVHATLATVNPNVAFHAPRVEAGAGVTVASVFQECICSKLAHEPLAKTATHPDCPIHGEKG